MSAPRVYGWCPGALRPMMSGDGLVVRVRPPLGRLTATQAKGIADLSQQYGNGLIDLSSRANLQVRGIDECGYPALIDGLRALGLIDRNIAAETRRNIVIQPFWKTGDATNRIACDLIDALSATTAPDLPGKFGFAVDCGDRPILQDVSADIRLETGADGLICRPDGAETGIAVTTKNAAEVALGMARWFLKTGGAPEGRGRMAAHVAQIVLPAGCHAPRLTGAMRPTPGAAAEGTLAALEFGQMAAETLARLAETGALRLTPWRMVLVEAVTGVDALPGLILEPDDPRLRVTACTGAPGCPQALSATRDIARALAGRVSDHLHVSGCAKGCAHPQACERTLVAIGEGRFDLIKQGRTTDIPVRTDLALPDLISGEL